MSLLGSIHVARSSTKLDAEVVRAFERADAVAVEIDVKGAEGQRAGRLLLERGLYPAGQSLVDVVGPRRWAALESHAPSLGMAADALARFRPWVVGLLLVLNRAAAAGVESTQGIDARVLAAARGRKPISSLETAEEQIDVFSGISDALQLRLLDELLEDLQSVGATFDGLVDAYERGDDAAIVVETRDENEHPELSDFNRRVFDRRNETMARRIDDLLEVPQNVLVTVGVGHLLGSGSVVERLRRAGCEVRRVAPAGRFASLPSAPRFSTGCPCSETSTRSAYRRTAPCSRIRRPPASGAAWWGPSPSGLASTP